MGRQSISSVSKCEEFHAIDLAWLRRKGILRSGGCESIHWSCRGEPTGSIAVVALPEGIRLMYRTRTGGGDWQDINELMPFVYTPTRFGGQRKWFKCLSCGSGCRVLYGGARFRCRPCHNLRYASQYEPAYQRAIDQADKLRKRVGGDRGAFNGDAFPPKPKGMHWATYWRLDGRYADLQNRWTVGVISKFGLP